MRSSPVLLSVSSLLPFLALLGGCGGASPETDAGADPAVAFAGAAGAPAPSGEAGGTGGSAPAHYPAPGVSGTGPKSTGPGAKGEDAGAAGAAGSAAVAGSAGSGGSGPAPGSAGASGAGGESTGGCDPSLARFRCDGAVLTACNPVTRAYEKTQDCASTELCDASAGVCHACLPGAPNPAGACESGTSRDVCNDKQDGYGKASACPASAPHCAGNHCEGCVVDADCPAPAGACEAARCEMGTCVAAPLSANVTPAGLPSGICDRWVCDGAGSLTHALGAKGKVVATEPVGVCFDTECNGVGGQSVVYKPKGTVVNPADTCKPTVCDGSGAAAPVSAAAGVLCFDGPDHNHACDGAGTCRTCMPGPSGPACSELLFCSPGMSPGDEAIYVAGDGDDKIGDGGPASPVATVQAAISLMMSGNTRRTIYVAHGEYATGITMPLELGGALVIDGGFTRAGAAWSRDCEPAAPLRTVFRVEDDHLVGPAVTTSLSGQFITLRSMTLHAGFSAGRVAAPGTAGKPAIGLWVVDGASVTLEGVKIEMGSGEAGGAGLTGAAGPAPDCGPTPPCGTGADGAPGLDPVSSAPSFTFGDTGYSGAPGQAGLPGGAGANGATPTPTEGHTCFPGTCSFSNFPSAHCEPPAAVTLTPAAGSCSCGGQGGLGGGGGQPGGASIAVYLAGPSAKLSAIASEVTGGKGGAGGPGGEGGPGSTGSTPTPGVSVTCDAEPTCVLSGNSCETMASASIVYSTTGTSGGQGGKGGRGSAGANGAAAAVVMNKAAGLSLSTTTLSPPDIRLY